MKDMEKKINMKCGICGNDQFSTVDETIEDLLNASNDAEIRCSDCGRVITKEQLIEENRHIIDVNVEDFKKEIFKEIQKDFQRRFR